MDVNYRWANENDIDAIKDFLASTFGPDSVQCLPGRFEWLYVDRPDGLHISLALANDKIVAFRGYMPWPVVLGDHQVTAGYAIDTMVAAEYRRRGIGEVFLKMWTERYPIGLSYGQSASMANLYRKIGFKKTADLKRNHIVRRLQLGTSMRSLARDSVSWAKYATRRNSIAGARREVDLEAAMTLCEKYRDRIASHEAGVIYDRNTFGWRFGGPVYRDYRFFKISQTATDGSGATTDIGLLVCRIDAGEEHLSEMICSPENRGELVALAIATSVEPRVMAYCSGTGLEKLFDASGALIRPHDAAVVVVTADPKIQELIDNQEWFHFIGEGDADMIRRPARAPKGHHIS